MTLRTLALAAAAGAALGLFAAGAEAAPAGTALNQALAASAAEAKPEAVAYRRCWWHRGHRHCRWYRGGPRHFGYYYGPTYPEHYRTGSSRWWQEMDRDDRGGRGSRF